MGKDRIPHVGRPFPTEITENDLNAVLRTGGNVRGMSVGWPLTIKNTQHGGIRIGFDLDGLLAQIRQMAIAPIWPVAVRDIRSNEDHFVWVQNCKRNDTNPWDGILAPTGKAYRVSIWGHGKARDFRPLLTRENTFTRETAIVTGFVAIGQNWVSQYLRFDLIQPRDQLQFTDCVAAFVGDR